MSLVTKKEIVQEIAYEIYAGVPSNDRSISDNFILRKLNDKIAEAAIKSAFGNYNLDGCTCVDDIFNLTYSNLNLLTDMATGLQYVPLPSQPVGIPGKRSIYVFPPANRGGVRNDIFKGIMRGEVTSVRSLPGMKKVYHYTENGNEYFLDEFQIMPTFNTVNMTVTTSGANDLAAFLNLPDDMISGLKVTIIQELRQMLGLQDTVVQPPMDNPQPR